MIAGPDHDDIVALVLRSRDGDEPAVRRLITIHQGLLFTIAFRMVGEPETARDLIQETFIRAFRKIGDLRTPEHFRSWLCAICRRVVLDHLRREKRKRTVPLEEVEVIVPDDRAVIRKRMIVQDALSRLSARDRMLLVLAYYQGNSLREVAHTMKIPEANVRVYVQRARDRLRELLKGREHELLSGIA